MRVPIFCLVVVALLGFQGTVHADKKGPSRSSMKETANGKYVFVMLSPGTLEEELRGHTTEEGKNQTTAIRNVYKKSGLYKAGSAEPLWTVDWYAPVTVLSDGVHLIRWGQPGLEQARAKVDRKTREITENDLKQEAISIYAKGKLVREFTIADLADDRNALKMSVTMLLWRKAHKLSDDEKQLEIVTHDGNTVLIDIPTGKIIEKKKAE